jgi:hypothetical protein
MARYRGAPTGHGHAPPHKQGGAMHTVHRHDGTTSGGQSLIGGVSNGPQTPMQGAGAGTANPSAAPPVLPPEMMPH